MNGPEAAVRSVLAGYPAALAPRSRPVPLGGGGGLSGASLWRFSTLGGPMLLRAWPPETRPERVATVHAWLAATRGMAWIAPPLADRQGRTFHESRGRVWEVAPWLPGKPDALRPPSAGRRRSALKALAELHRVLAGETHWGPSPNLIARRDELENWLLGDLDAIAARIDRLSADSVLAAARRWIEAARSLAPRLLAELTGAASQTLALQPCLRDVRAEHLLFEGDRVSGLIDYGAMGIDSVATDLARLLTEWEIEEAPWNEEGLAAYGSVRPLTDAERRLIPVFARSTALLGGGHWVRWHVVEGRRFEPSGVVVAGLDRSVRALGRIAAGGLIR